MKKSIAALYAGLFALLSAPAVLAATVTVTPSTASPTIGTDFVLTVSGAGFPDTVGATLQLTFDPTKVAVKEPSLNTGIRLAPGSPFTGGIVVPSACTPTYTSGSGPGGSVCNFSVLAPTVGTLPTGNFDAFELVFTALAVGSANIVLVDDQADFSWTEDLTFAAVPVTYTQANVTVVAAPPEPNISVTDSVVPADDLAVAYGNITVGTGNNQTVTVTNTGGVALTLGLVASANPLAAPFSITTDNCSSQVLAASSSCTITVRFSPTALVFSSDTFDIPSNDPQTATVTVAVNGTGTPPVPNIAVTDSIPDVNDRDLPFGDLTINTTITGTVTVTNSGDANLTIAAITPPAAPFSITTNNCSSAPVAPLSSCTITVQFAPVAVQASTGSFAIPSDDPDEPSVTVNLTGAGTPVPAPVIAVTDSVAPTADLAVPFGSITQGGTSTQTVTVTNSGNAGLDIGQVASANPLAAPFSVGTDTCSNQTVAPLATCTFQVVFTPTALGVVNDALDIPSNDPGTPSVTVSVSGTGIAMMIPDISVTDSVAPANDLQIPFGTVELSAAAVDQTVTVTNDGSGDLVIGVIGGPLPLAPPFSLVAAGSNCSGATLAPTESCTIVVRFEPTAEVDSVDSFSIPSNDPDEAFVTMALSGSGVQTGTILIDGGSSAVDPWSLAFLGALPLLRRRKAAAMKLAMAAAAGVLAAPAVMAADDRWDWDYDGVYLGAGMGGTSLQTSSSFNAALQSELALSGIPSSGSFEDFPLGGQLYAGWLFTNRWGMEIRWSDSGNGDSDIFLVDNAGARTRLGDIGVSVDGFTLYGVGNWPIAERWDLFGKLGYTRQDIAFDASVVDGGEGGPASFAASDDDVGPAAAVGARWRFARHWASTVEAEYLDVEFDNVIDKPWRVGLNVEYWFGGKEIAPPAPVAAAAVVAAPPPPPPAEPMDSDKDGIVDGSDQCADTPAGDRVGAAGCSCDVTRQLTFASDSSELSDADKLVLDEMAENLTRLKFVSGVIEGHTDSSGADTYNQGLSERRAQVAADYLASKGIATDRMQIVGRGETDPVGDNKTAEGRAENRRVVAKRTDCDQ